MNQPRFNRMPDVKFRFGGWLDEYVGAVTEQWLKVAPLSNPAMLEMFRDRDCMPLRDLLPWSGEFAGKYLTSAVQVYRLTRDTGLRAALDEFVQRLIACQDDDGYLGPWPKGFRLTGKAPNVFGTDGPTWDAWGHYHVMLGLLLWHAETGDRKALACVRKIAELFCRKFLDGKSRLVDTGSTEMNLAVIHALCLLYRKRRTERFLGLALQIADEFAAEGPEGPLAGDYVRTALDGKEFWQTPRPRWESLHPIMGIAALYWITGDEKLRRAFEHIWWSIVKLDRHNSGGFSSGEQAQGNPYHPGAIETCCTIAWIGMSVEMLRLTGRSVVADELELSTLNSVVGLHSRSGRWVTYDTPMDGVRRASAHAIVFQAREGSPELNCCSVNGARGFGMISDWALMTDGADLVLNYYGPSEMTAELPTGVTAGFGLHLRIPYWSAQSRVSVNGRAVERVAPARYCVIERVWKRGDVVEIRLDMSEHFWPGEKQCKGKVSVYRGPLLLAYDRRFNDVDPDEIPPLDAAAMTGRLVKWNGAMPPIVLMEYTAGDGRKVKLCDFGSAGEGGSPYRSWLRITEHACEIRAVLTGQQLSANGHFKTMRTENIS
jgi:DUF1680 family protein